MGKPSSIKTVIGKTTKLLSANFQAITWCGVVYCRKKEMAEEINKDDNINSLLESHETIHVRQAEDTKDSWFFFYLNYVWQWICNFPLIFINLYAPYKFIPYEIEAYRYQNDWNYCLGICNKWRDYKKIKFKNKWKYAKEYYKNRRIISFTDFIIKNIDKDL